MMKKLIEQLKSKKILVSDGAWGTALHKKGLQPGEAPELWNVTHREDVFQIAKNYINAGSDIIETNSFGGSRFKLNHYGLSERAYELNREAAQISRKAAEDKIVMGSIGPTGEFLIMGNVTEEQMYEAFKEQAIALRDGGADAIIIETFYALDEAQSAVKAVKKNTELEIICSFTFDKLSDSTYKTMSGISPTEMIDTLVNEGVDIIGTNCGNGFEGIVGIIEEMRKVNKDIPLLVQANAGLPQEKDGKLIYPTTPERVAEIVPQLIEAGANIIGGCCGTTPAHISAIKNKVDSIIFPS